MHFVFSLVNDRYILKIIGFLKIHQHGAIQLAEILFLSTFISLWKTKQSESVGIFSFKAEMQAHGFQYTQSWQRHRKGNSWWHTGDGESNVDVEPRPYTQTQEEPSKAGGGDNTACAVGSEHPLGHQGHPLPLQWHLWKDPTPTCLLVLCHLNFKAEESSSHVGFLLLFSVSLL